MIHFNQHHFLHSLEITVTCNYRVQDLFLSFFSPSLQENKKNMSYDYIYIHGSYDHTTTFSMSRYLICGSNSSVAAVDDAGALNTPSASSVAPLGSSAKNAASAAASSALPGCGQVGIIL